MWVCECVSVYVACEPSRQHRSVWEDKSVTSYQPQARQTHTRTHNGIICHLISAIRQGLSLQGCGRGGRQEGAKKEGSWGMEDEGESWGIKKENGKWDERRGEVTEKREIKRKGSKGESPVMTTFPSGDKEWWRKTGINDQRGGMVG